MNPWKQTCGLPAVHSPPPPAARPWGSSGGRWPTSPPPPPSSSAFQPAAGTSLPPSAPRAPRALCAATPLLTWRPGAPGAPQEGQALLPSIHSGSASFLIREALKKTFFFSFLFYGIFQTQNEKKTVGNQHLVTQSLP